MLWLLRHAEAADGLPDDERPLTDLGMRQAEAAGLALARLGTNIDACLSSPKLRALQTAQIACEPLGISVTVEPALSGEPFDVHDLTAGRATSCSSATTHRSRSRFTISREPRRG